MSQVTGIGLSFRVLLLLLASCADQSYQVRQPGGYGEMPPGETWVPVDSAYQSPSREMVYYDPKTIRRDGDLVTLWQLTDYKWMQGNAPFGTFMMSPHRFFSTKTHKEFDCAHNRVRLLASSEFSQHMGTGTHSAVLVSQGSGHPVEPGSINQALWEVACGVTNTPS
ncbi:MAG TPA: surface-adhesin E family protein [Nitrospira sp.]|nr:surface-adhesin E family protein [Nitrospira sp.]